VLSLVVEGAGAKAFFVSEFELVIFVCVDRPGVFVDCELLMEVEFIVCE